MSTASGYRRILALPPEELAVLRERAREVARVPEAGPSGEVLEVLEVHGGGQAFALPLTAVEGVVELTTLAAVPRAAPAVCGLVPFRGEVLLGVELAQLVGTRSGGIADLRRVVAVCARERKVALLVERAVAVRSVPVAGFRADALARRPFLVGTDADFLTLLEPGALVDAALAEDAGT